jgi:hypothetical protein
MVRRRVWIQRSSDARSSVSCQSFWWPFVGGNGGKKVEVQERREEKEGREENKPESTFF